MIKSCKYIIFLSFFLSTFSYSSSLELRKEALSSFHKVSWMLSEMTKSYLPHSNFNQYYQNCPLNLQKPPSETEIKQLEKLFAEADAKIKNIFNSIDAKKISFSNPELDNEFKNPSQVLIEYESELVKWDGKICYPKFYANIDNAVKAFLSPSLVPAFIYLENKVRDMGTAETPFTVVEIGKYFGWYLEIRQHYNLLLEIFKLTQNHSLPSLSPFEVNPQVANLLNYTQQQYGSLIDARKSKFYYFDSKFTLVEPPHERRLTPEEIAYAKMAIKKDYPHLLTGVKDLALNFLFQEYQLTKQFLKEEDIQKDSTLNIPNACLDKKDDYLIQSQIAATQNSYEKSKEQIAKLPLIEAVSTLIKSYVEGEKKFPTSVVTEYFYSEAYKYINVLAEISKASFKARLSKEIKISIFDIHNIFKSLESLFPYSAYMAFHPTGEEKLKPKDFLSLFSDKLQKWVLIVPGEYFESAKKGATKELIDSLEEPIKALLIDSLEAYVLSQVSQNLKPFAEDPQAQQFKDYLSYFWTTVVRQKWEASIDSVEMKKMITALSTEIVKNLSTEKAWHEASSTYAESIRFQRNLIQVSGTEQVVAEQVKSYQAEKFLRSLEAEHYRENFIPFTDYTKHTLSELSLKGISEPNATLAQDFTGLQKIFLQKAQGNAESLARKIRQYLAKTYQLEESMVDAYLKKRYPKLVSSSQLSPSQVLADEVIQGSLEEILNSNFEENRFTHVESQIARYSSFMRMVESQKAEKHYSIRKTSITQRLYNSTLKDSLEKLYQNQNNPKIFSEWQQILSLQLQSILKDEAVLEVAPQDIWPDYLKYRKNVEKIKIYNQEIEKLSQEVKKPWGTTKEAPWALMVAYLQKNKDTVKKLYLNRLQVLFESYLLDYFNKEVPADKKKAALFGITEELYTLLGISKFKAIDSTVHKEKLSNIIEQGEKDYKKSISQTVKVTSSAYEFLIPYLEKNVFNNKDLNFVDVWYDTNIHFKYNEQATKDDEIIERNAAASELRKMLSTGFAPIYSKKLIWIEDYYFEKVLSRQILPSYAQVRDEFLDILNSHFEKNTLSEIEDLKQLKNKIAPLKEYLAHPGGEVPSSILKDYQHYIHVKQLLSEDLQKWQKVHLILVKYFPGFSEEVAEIIKGEKNAKDYEEAKIKEFIWDEFQNTTTGTRGEDLALTPNEIENDLKFIASQSQQKRELKKEDLDIFATEVSEYCRVGVTAGYFETFEKNYQAALKSLPATIPADLKKYLNLNAKQFCEKIQVDVKNLKAKFEIEKAWDLIHLRELFFNDESDFNAILTPEKVYYFSKAPTADFNVVVKKTSQTLFEQTVVKPQYSNYLWIANTLKNFLVEANLNLGFINPLSVILSKPTAEKFVLFNSFSGEFRGKLFNTFNQSLISKLNSPQGLEVLFPKNKVAPLSINKIHHQFRLAIALWKSLREYQRKQLIYGEKFVYSPLLNNLSDYLFLQFYRYTPLKLKGTPKDFKLVESATKALNIDHFILEYESKYPLSKELPKNYSNKDWVQPVTEELAQEENERGLDFFVWNYVNDSLRPETDPDYLDKSIAWDRFCYGELKKGNLCQNRPFIDYPVAWKLTGEELKNEQAFAEYWQALLQSPIANKKLKDLKLPKGKRHVWNLPNVNTIANFEKHPLKKQYVELLKLFDRNSKVKVTPNTIGYFLVVLNSASKKSEPIDLYKKPETDTDKSPTHRELLHLLPLLVNSDVLEINKRDFEGWKNTLSEIDPSAWQHYYLEKYLASIGNGQSFYTTQVPACQASKPLQASPSILSKVYNNKDKTEAYHDRFIKIQLEQQGYSGLQKPLSENGSEWQLAKNDSTYWQKVSGNPGKNTLESLSHSLNIAESDMIKTLQAREKFILFKKILNEINAEGSVSKAELEKLWLGFSNEKIDLKESGLEKQLRALLEKAEAFTDKKYIPAAKEKMPDIDSLFKLLAEAHLHEETNKIVASNIHQELETLCKMPNFNDIKEKKDFDQNGHKEEIKRLAQYNNIHKNLLNEEGFSPTLHYELKDYLAKYKENNQPIVHKVSQNIMTWGFGLFLGGAAIKEGLLPSKASSWVNYKTSQSSFLQKNAGRAGVLMNLLLIGSLSADMIYRYHDKYIDEPNEFKKINETRNTKSSVKPEKSAMPLMDSQMVSQIEQFKKKTQEDLYAWDTNALLGVDAALTLPIVAGIAYRFATPVWRLIRGGDRSLLRTAQNYFKIDPASKMTPEKIKSTLLVESPQTIERKAVTQFETVLGATEENGLIRIKPENAKYLQEDLAILRNKAKLKAEPTFQADSAKFKKFLENEKEASLRRMAILENFERKLALNEPFTREEMEELMWVLPQDFAPYTRQIPFLLRMLGVDMPITQAGRDLNRAHKISQAYLDLIKEFHPEFRFTMAMLSAGKYNLDDFVLNEAKDLKKLIDGPPELEKHFREVFAKAKEFSKLSTYDVIGEERLHQELSRLKRFYQYMTANENQFQANWVLENLSAFESTKWEARHFQAEAKLLKQKYGEITFNTYAQDFLVRKNVAFSFETQRKMMNFKSLCEWYDREFVKVQQYARTKGYSIDEVLQQMLGLKTRVILDGAEGEVLKQLGASLKENLTQSGWKGNLGLLRAIANEDYQQMVRLLFVSKE